MQTAFMSGGGWRCAQARSSRCSPWRGYESKSRHHHPFHRRHQEAARIPAAGGGRRRCRRGKAEGSARGAPPGDRGRRRADRGSVRERQVSAGLPGAEEAARLCHPGRQFQGLAMRAVAFAIALLAPAACSFAQSLEPRSYSASPVGLNFLIAGYAASRGDVGFDAAAPLQNGNIRVQSVPIGYVRTLDVLGNSGSIALVLPFASLSGSATINGGGEVTRDISGMADPAVRVAVNFYGAPAMSAAQFASYRQDLIVGASVSVSAPFGQYDPERLVNLGSNRWSVKPELGLSQALGPWTVEFAASATWYSRNDEYFQGNALEQDPIYSGQLHLTRQFGRGIWAAASATYYEGGRTSLNGVARDDRQAGTRFGLTFSVPVSREQSIKLFANSGLYARTGTDFDSVGLAWQYRWGGGL